MVSVAESESVRSIVSNVDIDSVAFELPSICEGVVMASVIVGDEIWAALTSYR